jgi:signal recognition particle subunit SRP54
MGPLESILGMIPGMSQLKGAMGAVDEKEMDRVEAIINSMTPAERDDHTLMNGSRRKRIARGSGRSVEEVNRLLKQFIEMKKMLKVVGGLGQGGGGNKAAMRKKMGMLKQMMQQHGR